MTMRNNAIVAPDPLPVTSPEIGATERQQTLHIGPTGVVHKGGGTVPWAKRCALSSTPSPSSKLLFMVLASFVNGPDEAAWPSQSTLATMTGLTARGSPKRDQATRGGGPDSSRADGRRQGDPVLARGGSEFPL